MASKSSYEPGTWRLINSGFLRGPQNMAVDEAIMESVASGDSPPTLRFYGWQPACLSLGIAQEWDVVDLARCADLGWDVVRRATGGRAILHVDELTYSVCAPKEEPRVQGAILESYERLSEALLAGLRLMGLEPRRVKSYYQDKGESGPACFDGPADFEILMGQHKLLGSAQVRKKGVVLQHGTLPLFGDITRIAEALYFDLPGQRDALRSRMHYRATTVLNSLGRKLEFNEAADFMSRGFASELDLTLEPDGLTAQETWRAAEIEAEKYGTEAWTKRV
jgi:lipoate-protein ligase A